MKVLALGGRRDTLGRQQLGHALAIVDVHLAAEALDPEGLGGTADFHEAPLLGDRAAKLKPQRRGNGALRLHCHRLALQRCIP